MSDREPPVEKADLNQEISPVADGAIASVSDLDALQAEVSKWQERVPKLAAALRERTDELAQARDEIRALKSQSEGSGADVARRARESLIEELEGKVKELRGKVQSLGGELHTSGLAPGRSAGRSGELEIQVARSYRLPGRCLATASGKRSTGPVGDCGTRI